jgi:hypothetical protein
VPPFTPRERGCRPLPPDPCATLPSYLAVDARMKRARGRVARSTTAGETEPPSRPHLWLRTLMKSTPPIRSGNRWLWSTARQVRVGIGSVVVILGRSLREAASSSVRHPWVRRVVRDLLRHTPRLRLRIKRLVMAFEYHVASRRRTFGPPPVARMPARTADASAHSESRKPSLSAATRFTVAESIQPSVDVENVRARIRPPR